MFEIYTTMCVTSHLEKPKWYEGDTQTTTTTDNYVCIVLLGKTKKTPYLVTVTPTYNLDFIFTQSLPK